MFKIVNAYPRHTVFFDRRILYIIIKSFFKNGYFGGYKKIPEFEQAFSDYVGSKEAVAVPSGRLALYLILKVLKFPAGSEIIVSDYNFPPIISVIIQSGLKPVFIDIDPHTFNIDAAKIEARLSCRSKAILVTHMFGCPCAMDSINDIAGRYGLKIIEDGAHAFGAQWHAKRIGNLGDSAFFSLGDGKNIASFEGGVITTSDIKIASDIRRELEFLLKPNPAVVLKKITKTIFAYLMTQRQLFNMFVYPLFKNLGYSLWKVIEKTSIEKKLLRLEPKNITRFSGLQAAVGLHQVSRISQYLEKKMKIIEYLDKELSGIESIAIQKTPEHERNYKPHYVVYAKDRSREQILDLRRKLLNDGVDTQFLDMHACSSLSEFKSYAGYCPNAAVIAPNVFEIPSDISLNLEDLDAIIHNLKQCII